MELKIQNITKRYRDKTAVDDVSITLTPGVWGLLGANGAGKTTLMRMLAGILRPSSGRILCDGVEIGTLGAAYREKLGYLPQEFGFYPEFTVQDYLEYMAALKGLPRTEAARQIDALLERVSLTEVRRKKIVKLSGGMKQKLALCCALIHRPAVLLLDEPTTGVDAVSRSEFWDMLSELKGKGISMLVSTPYMDEAVRCDRVALCDGGKILAVDTPQGVVGRFDEPLYALAGDDMYGLLLEARRHADVKECYPFGQTPPLIAGEGFDAGRFVRETTARGFRRVTLRPVGAGIEDVFIKLMRHA